ncbi:hypothetical protein TSTA_013060 [Talaromyces stipitatus ATCC 10500]|uniref:Uncharacterized protein n=1 Tax=Talaromyces stipitatus (strain ATCC 10500 / CBS 375.48 / QM 6759 / NRRL 1006) TaxID=441959 RepID=B8MFA1_TALSN|nr:uncharacterized protein TSTA_013060 [Talaromyces stipitatus ATCC 10500]EED16200.1 hypothetical protein TSTA_013060 [Talaromyces stipitatus ATCC 10500]
MWHLIITLGVLSAVGKELLFTPTILYLDEWFIRRKGLSLGSYVDESFSLWNE